MFVLSSAEFLVAEGHELRFSVMRRGDASLEESVLVSTSAGTAKRAVDYEHLSERMIFLPGERQKDLSIQIYSDDELEFEEYFTIQLLRIPQIYPGYAGSLGTPDTARVRILDTNNNDY